MGSYTWEMGKQTEPPKFPDIIQDEGGTVEPRLELFGQILDARDIPGALPKFENILDETVDLSGSDARVLIGSLGSIYPPYFMRETFQVPEDTMARVHTCLQNYIAAKSKQDHDSCKTICDAIAEILQLKVARRPGVEHTIRLKRRVRSRESVCKVKCTICGLAYLIRLYIWSQPGENAYLYRIPGLRYEYSMPDGVGLVLENHRIIGRMRLGVKNCDCCKVEQVLIL